MSFLRRNNNMILILNVQQKIIAIGVPEGRGYTSSDRIKCWCNERVHPLQTATFYINTQDIVW